MTYFPLRSNAFAPFAGPRVAWVRRRTPAAALLSDQVTVAAGLHVAWAGLHAEFKFARERAEVRE